MPVRRECGDLACYPEPQLLHARAQGAGMEALAFKLSICYPA
jgi:hypothetical protein